MKYKTFQRTAATILMFCLIFNMAACKKDTSDGNSSSKDSKKNNEFSINYNSSIFDDLFPSSDLPSENGSNSSNSSSKGGSGSLKGTLTSTRAIKDVPEDQWDAMLPEEERFFSISEKDRNTKYEENTLYYMNLRKIIDDAKESGITSKILRDTMELIVAIQGLVNREKPRIYINFVRNHWEIPSMVGANNKFYPAPDRFWFDELRKPGEYLADKKVVEIYSVGKLIDMFKDKVDGAVVWDEDVYATSNVACTVAGVENLVPVRYELGIGVFDWFIRRNKIFKVKRNLVDLFSGEGRIPETNLGSTGSAKNDAYLWAKFNYLDTKKTNPKLIFYVVDAMPWSTGDPYPDLENLMIVNKDYYFEKKAFFFDLNCAPDNIASDDRGQRPGTDYRTLSKILRQQNLNAGGELVTYGGFAPWWIKYTTVSGEGLPDALQLEIESAELFMPYYMNTDAEAAKGMSNGSIFDKIPLKDLKQNSKNNGQPLENKNYIMLYMGDYDSSAWTNSLMPGVFNDPGKGRIPLAWGISSILSNKIPHVFNYLYSNKTPNDYFVMANSGAAHFSVEYITKNRPEGLLGTVDNWINLNKNMASRFDLDIGGFLIHNNTDIKSTFDVYSQFIKIGAATTAKIPDRIYNGKAFIEAEMASDINTDVRYIADFIGNRLNPVTDGPSFKVYRCVWTTPTMLADAIDIVKQKFPTRNAEVVDPYTFFRLYNESLKK